MVEKAVLRCRFLWIAYFFYRVVRPEIQKIWEILHGQTGLTGGFSENSGLSLEIPRDMLALLFVINTYKMAKPQRCHQCF
jgi:hypothetical protein